MNFASQIEKERVFKVVAEKARSLNLETYVVGGYVRDLILKRPSKDIDFVCVGSGIELAKAVGEEFKKKPTIFKNFGTARIIANGNELEFVGARKESYNKDSRKPFVEDGSLKDDQDRRDFTINALAVSLNAADYGELIDPFDGLSDLKKEMIRTPGDPEITFSDDPLRMVRAVRFASQLTFDIHPDTFEAIKENIGRLEIVSQERITTELNKIICSPLPSYGFKLLYHSGILEAVFPEMVKLQGVEVVEGNAHKDNFYHTLQVLDNVSDMSDDLWLRWSAILHDIAKPKTKRYEHKQGWTFHGHEDLGARMVPGIFKRMKLPMGEKMKYVQKLVRLHLRPIALVSDKITDTAVRRLLFEAGDDVEDLMKLCRADVTSKNPARIKKYLNNFDKVERKMEEVEEKDRIRNFQPPVSGEMVMQTFGISPSKVVGEIKDEIKEAILDGRIGNNRDEAFELMLKLGAEKGLKVAD